MSKNTDLGNLVNGLFVNSSGNVGVKNTNPTVALDVTGAARVSGASTFNGAVTIGNDTTYGLTIGRYSAGIPISYIKASTSSTGGFRLTNHNGSDVIIVDGSNNLTLDSPITNITGNVGIGTSSPSQLLHVNNSTQSIIRNSSGTRSLQIESYSTDWNYITSAGQNFAIKADGAFPLVFFTNGNERMRINSAGDIGIGTGSPLYKTHIVNAGGNAFLGISNQGVSNGDRQIRIGFGGNGSDTFAQIQGTRYNVADDINVVMQAGGGNVGIGATGPSQKLEVAGTVLASSFLSATGLSYPAINTWTTFYTMAAQRGIYSVIIGFSAGTEDIATWFAYGTLFTQGSAGAFSTLSNGSLVQMRVSGLNIQVLLTPGASFTRELSFKVIRT
jgi:hypothetical protein